jgi:hypothetical protein
MICKPTQKKIWYHDGTVVLQYIKGITPQPEHDDGSMISQRVILANSMGKLAASRNR